MGIFGEIAIRYCEKIYGAYKKEADERDIKGIEAELLIQRNEFARCLIETLKKIEVEDNDYDKYFQQLLNEIKTTSEQVAESVKEYNKEHKEYNKEHKTEFTSDLFATFFTSSLINFINTLSDLHQKSLEILTKIEDKSLFKNDRSVPWIYQFSYVLYEYILEKEFELATNKSNRDIFDDKKDLVLKTMQKVVTVYSRFQNEENNTEYKGLMDALLENMRLAEKNLQRRKPQESTTGSLSSYFTQTFYKLDSAVFINLTNNNRTIRLLSDI